MPLGYKYVERTADSQINWAEVGREASGMLLEVNRVREEKKEAYNQATREEMNNIMNAPQGENQDANGFINNYAHDMINQMKIDEDLFKRGMLKERDYTLKRQNNMDGTKSLFEIQKLYQQKYKEKMDGVMSGTLQAMNIFNMGMVEGYGDFNNSKASINPADGTVGIGLMENKMIDGKMVRILSKNIANVNVIKGKIMHDIPTFDVDAQTTKTIANFGSRKDILYKAATLSGAGTITELMGIDFLNTLTDPVDKKIVTDMNDAIDLQIDSFFSDTYKISSVLTENLGKYNSQSFTFDKDVGNSDPNKILVTIDPNTGLTTLDTSGKNYEAQKKEARDWVKADMLRKMDQERGIKTTNQNELQESEATKAKSRPKAKEDDDADTATNMIGKLWYGDDNQVSSSVTYFKGLKNSNGEVIFKDIIREPKGITVLLANGTKEYVEFLDKNGRPKTQEDFIASVGPLLAGQLDVSKSLKKGAYERGAIFNASSYGRGSTIEEFKLPNDVLAKPSQEAVSDIDNALPEGFTAKDIGGRFGNEVEVTSPLGKKYIVKTKKSSATAGVIAVGLEDFIIAQQKKVEEERLKDVDPKTKTTSKGVGAKYN
jgi:hypothetical protein